MPHKLLLADDSVTIQRVIELTFAEEDIQVIAVSDGDQAVARLEAEPPDIVLADVGMPGRNGYEVAAYMKASPRLAHIPIMLLTGAFEPVDQVRADAVGCDGVLAKPFEPQLVISRVKDLLARPGRVPVSLDAALAPPGTVPAERWAPPLADPPPAAAAEPAGKPAAAVGSAGADAYFDRLDAAFASLSSGAALPAKPAAAPPSNPVTDSIDWFAPKPDAPAPDLPLSYGSEQRNFEPPSAAAAAPRMDTVEPRSQEVTPAPAPAPRATLPPLADAFAALLAAEQSMPAPPGAATWPVSPIEQTPAALPGVVTDEMVEQVTRRVIERLSDRTVGDAVSEIVSATAERLVREEIERIKRTIT